MQTIIAQPGQNAHPDPDSAAQQRADRLARVTAEQMEAALAYLSMVDPEAFEIAFTAAAPPAGETHEDDEAIPVCRRCGGLVGIFLSCGLEWRHFRGDGQVVGNRRGEDGGNVNVRGSEAEPGDRGEQPGFRERHQGLGNPGVNREWPPIGRA